MPFALPISLLRYLGAAVCDSWGRHDVGSGIGTRHIRKVVIDNGMSRYRQILYA
jgi:hypothetical protein